MFPRIRLSGLSLIASRDSPDLPVGVAVKLLVVVSSAGRSRRSGSSQAGATGCNRLRRQRKSRLEVSLMQRLIQYARQPLTFCALYMRRRWVGHGIVLAAVIGAVACSVSTQYGMKFLVDTLSQGALHGRLWLAFSLLIALITGDSLLWRVAGWVANYTFVAVTGDMRGDLFRYLTGHAPRYFAERL